MAELVLKGDIYSLEIAEKNFSENECCIQRTDDNEEYRLKSTKLQDLANEKEILSKGQELVDYVNSILAFVKTDYIPFICSCYYIGEESHEFYSDRIKLKHDGNFINLDGKKIDLDANLINKIKCLYRSDEVLKEIMEIYLKKEKNWDNLYKIYEELKNSKNPLKEGWITEKEDDSFRFTANSYEISGIESRHTKRNKKGEIPQEKKMDIFCAINLIRTIVVKYILENNSDEK